MTRFPTMVVAGVFLVFFEVFRGLFRQLALSPKVTSFTTRRCLMGIDYGTNVHGSMSVLLYTHNERHFKTFRRRFMASSTFSRLLKALMRMKPCPQRPKPAPGVVTTWARLSSLSKNFQESLPTFTQM